MPCGANERYEHSDVAQDPEDLAPAYVAAEFHQESVFTVSAKNKRPAKKQKHTAPKPLAKKKRPQKGKDGGKPKKRRKRE